jgi:zinc transport system substrate-binding protein
MRTATALAIASVFAVAGCGPSATQDHGAVDQAGVETRLVVFTVNYPLAYFAERIGGDLADVRFPAPADVDPAYWSPDAETIAEYQSADLILLNGAGYARWVDRAALPDSRVVDTSASFDDRLIRLNSTITHSHGAEGAHEHTGSAFTTWLDPQLAIEQAQAVTRSLISLRRDREAELNAHFVELESELRSLDDRLAAAAEIIGDTPLMFSHPVYQYLIRRYNFNAVEFHWEPDEAPDGRAWSNFEDIVARFPAKWMLWEGEPLEATVNGLEELGVGSLLFDPCGNVPDSGDFMTVMAANAGALETIAETSSSDTDSP